MNWNMVIILVLASCLVKSEAKQECGIRDWYQCGSNCFGVENQCICGNESWTGKAIHDETVNTGCCPTSLDSCSKDQLGMIHK